MWKVTEKIMKIDEVPPTVKVSPLITAVNEIAPNDSLPPNWYEEYDQDGHMYYYNEVTGESTWERPC